MNKTLIDAFAEATKSVLMMMAGTEVEMDGMMDGRQKVYGDISGVIGLTGSMSGSIALTLPVELAKRLVANMLAMDASELQEEDVQDGVGEIINMIAGDAKGRCNDSFKISLPSVITGKRHTVSTSKEGDGVIIAFKEKVPFYLQISLEEK